MVKMMGRKMVIVGVVVGIVILMILSIAFMGYVELGEDDQEMVVAVTIPPQEEWVNEIGGDNVEVVVMVPQGEDPHTYDPDPGLMQELSKADLYFKLGSGMEFEERYMDTMMDQNPDMEIVDASEAITLRHFGEDHEHEIGEFEIIDRSTEEVTAYVHADHWHGSLPEVPLYDHISLGANIEDVEGNEVELDGDYELKVDLAEDANEGIVSFDEHTDHVHIKGEEEGNTRVVFQLWHDDHIEYETPSIGVFVGEEDQNTLTSNLSLADHDHDEGADPHTWLSLTKAEKMIEHLFSEIVETDPDNKDLYSENADEYITELQDLHQEISEKMEPYHGEKFLIYHPSMGYFADDYGLEQLAVEIDGEDPGPGQIAGIIDIAKEENINVVFVSPQFDDDAAKTIADEIDGEAESLNPLAEDYLDNIEDIAQTLIKSFEEKDHDHEDEIGEFKIIDRDTDEEVAYVHDDHWHGELPEVSEGEHVSLGAYIEDDHGDEIELGDEYQLGVRLAEGADDIVSFDEHGDHVHIEGEEEGSTEVVFQLIHNDHIDYETPPIEVEVE